MHKNSKNAKIKEKSRIFKLNSWFLHFRLKMNLNVDKIYSIDMETFKTDESFYVVLSYPHGLDKIVHSLDSLQRDYDILEEPLGISSV